MLMMRNGKMDFFTGYLQRCGWMFGWETAETAGRFRLRGAPVKRLRVATLTTPEMQRIAPSPRVRRVADGALGLVRQKRTLAVIAGQRPPLRIHIVLTADFLATGAAPANGHRAKSSPLIGRRIAHEKVGS